EGAGRQIIPTALKGTSQEKCLYPPPYLHPPMPVSRCRFPVSGALLSQYLSLLITIALTQAGTIIHGILHYKNAGATTGIRSS
ncbi:hypothetical protein, partial [Agriterribacter sp.]|uniref:hypothetical protein n=1 Tax=Agriterribacter sp. TaxID=2821509 RepID=UPI002C3EB1C2